MSAERPLLVYLELADEESGNEYSWDADAADGSVYAIYYKRGTFLVDGDNSDRPLIDTYFEDHTLLVSRKALILLLADIFDTSALDDHSRCICGFVTIHLDDPLNCPKCSRRLRTPKAMEIHSVPASSETYQITFGDIPLTLQAERDLLWEGRDEEGVAFLILCSGESASFLRPKDLQGLQTAFQIVSSQKRWDDRAGELWTLDRAAFEIFLQINMEKFECLNCHLVDEKPMSICDDCLALGVGN